MLRIWGRCLLLASAVLSLAGAGDAQQPDAPPPRTKLPAVLTAKPLEVDAKDDDGRKLCKARYNEAVAALKLGHQQFLAGARSFDSLLAMSRELLQAGLDVSATPKARVALLGEHLEMTRWLEGHVEKLLNVGMLTRADLHRARGFRLDAEIRLLRARGALNDKTREKGSRKPAAKKSAAPEDREKLTH